MNYETKYLKYKEKYLKLKNFDQLGGSKILINKTVDESAIKLLISVIPNQILVFDISKLIEEYIIDTTSKQIIKSLVESKIVALSDAYIKLRYPIIKTNEPVRYNLNYEPINWSKLKYLYKKNASTIEVINLLKGIGLLRAITVKYLKNVIISNFIQGCYNESGSTTLISDNDITYTTLQQPKLSVIMMDLFYKIFEQLFLDSSADVFDVNYYICSSIIKHSCYAATNTGPIRIINQPNYNITYKKMNKLNRLFKCNNDNISPISINNSLDQTVCSNYKFCTHDQTLIKNPLDKIFKMKEMKGETIYVLSYPDLPTDTASSTIKKYNSYVNFDLYMCFTLLYNTIHNQLLNINQTINLPTNNNSDMFILPDNKEKLYDRNLKYSYAYYSTLESIKTNINDYCDLNLKIKIIFMLKILMYLMSVTANEAYVSDLTVGIIVYGDTLNEPDHNLLKLKMFICFLDNFRFILEWYHTIDKFNSDSKYNLFDSICKYYGRIMKLGSIYETTISKIINKDLLLKYNSEERSNGQLILYAEHKINSTTGDNHAESGFNQTIQSIYHIIKDKSYLHMIGPLIELYGSELNDILEFAKSNDKTDNIIESCNIFYNKINSILTN